MTSRLSFDPYDHRLQDDPYPTYARLRDEAPLHHEAGHGYWVLSRHADIHRALRADAPYSSALGVSLDTSAWNADAHLVMSFLAMDPPGQTRLRKLVSRGFTPRRVAELESQVQRISGRYLDEAMGKDEEGFDWVRDVAGKLPMDVISEMVGVPEADRDEVRRLADLLVAREDGLRDVPAAGMAAAGQLLDYYRAHVQERQRRPADDLTSALLVTEADGEQMTAEEVMAFVFLMVVAGNETTTKLLGNALYHLTARPDLRERVFADADLVGPWIEETLRYDSSTQLLVRHLVQDVTLHGSTAPAGCQMVLLLGAANHDERVFTDPERFALDRSREELGQLLSFGGGRHFCLGANLARLEARIALTELVGRARTVEVDHDRCERFYSANVRGFASMPATVQARP